MSQQQSKPTKTYATTSTRGCLFSKDYSQSINHKCLECEFCHINTNPPPKKIEKRWTRLNNEKHYNPHLYDVPITIGRYCDPLLSKTTTDHSYNFMKDILSGGGQVIFKTSQANIPDDMIDLFCQYKDNVLIQLRLISDKTYTGAIVQKIMAPRFSMAKDIMKTAHELSFYKGLNVAFIFDPFIIGVNDKDLPSIIERASMIHVNKVVVKQLFSTDYFKDFLSKMVDKRHVNILTENYNGFWTYNDKVYLGALLPSLEEANKHEGFEIGICSNKYVNQLVCKNNNCCLFDNPKAVYNLDVNHMRRKDTQLIIPLKDNNVKV